MIPEWEKPGVQGFLRLEDFELIKRRRRQMLIHSYLYYRRDESVISDHLWQKWADELVELQAASPEAVMIDFYDEAFHDWDGSTGFHLPADLGIAKAGQRLLDQVKEVEAATVNPKRRRLWT